MSVNGTQLKMMYENEQLMDMTDIFEQYAAPFTKEVLNSDGGDGLRASSFDGRLYAIPKVGSPLLSAKVLWVRTDWLESLNMELPKTAEDFMEVAEAFTSKDPDGNGVRDTFGLAVYKDMFGSGYASLEGFFNMYGAYPNIWVALAMHYRKLGLWQESANILCGYTKAASAPYAMAYYYLADSLARLGDNSVWAQAAGADDRYCFPNSLEDYHVLRIAVQANPSDANAYYALGCFLYDKKRYAQARDMWEKSAGLNPGRAGTYRNLALYFANKENNYAKALTLLEKAVALDPADARIFYELCELYVKTGMSAAQLYPIMKLHASLVQSRDDLTMIYAQVLNSLGEHEKVIDLLTSRRFHPWEGGEGKVPTQHIEARIGLARRLIAEGRFQKAVSHLEKATIYYENFGEGKLAGAQKNNIHYYMGLALQKIDPKRSRACLAKAAQGLSEPASVMYYNDQPPHMIYYQGLALKALGQQDEAARRFNKLIAYGKKHIFEKQVMDYFAVSLPDFLVFETDLDEKSRVHRYYMMGLGYLGLGQKGEAIQAFDAGLALAPNHYGLQTHRKQADHTPD